MIEALRFIQEEAYKKVNKITTKPIISEQEGIIRAVDGGSTIIIDGGTWLLSKIRVASVEYKNDKRIISNCYKKDYYYSIIKNTDYKHKLTSDYECRQYSNKLGINKIIEAPAVMMKTLEYEHALRIINEMSEDSLLILDGLLTSDTPDQQSLLKELENKSRKNKINVIGLAKTFRQSINGQNMIGLLLRNNKGKWFYNQGNYWFVKLHEKSKHAYAFNQFSHTNTKRVIELLTHYSKDPTLLGYPYPLLRVDADARISSYEKKSEVNKARIISKKKGFDFVATDESSSDMHSLMDTGRYR